MNAYDILRCGAGEQKRLAHIAEMVQNITGAHDIGKCFRDTGKADNARAFLTALNGEQARLNMEIGLLDTCRRDAEGLSEALEACALMVLSLGDASLAGLSAERAGELRISAMVASQTAGSALAARERYAKYEESFSLAEKELSAALKQFDAADLLVILKKTQQTAQEASRAIPNEQKSTYLNMKLHT